MSERITRAEFARRAGVNKSTVTRWIENGRITIGADGLLDEAEAHSQRAASESPAPHHQARKAQLELEKASNPTGPASATPQTAAERAARATTTATQAGGAPDGELGAEPIGTDPSGADVLELPPASDAGAVVRRTRYAQMLEREAVARMKAREDQEAAGQLIRRSAVERAMTDATAVILNAAETLPDRVAPLLVNIDDQARIRALLRDEVEQFLATASAQLALVVEGRG
ncbi:helix-turn-helix domain-containing protein [Thiohalocapsa marina]|uniref:helix-turn-helix domain-containing protein n=1 Tax=Thiohalocapsa marina TaxID=424902 RepID=UPI0036DD2067